MASGLRHLEPSIVEKHSDEVSYLHDKNTLRPQLSAPIVLWFWLGDYAGWTVELKELPDELQAVRASAPGSRLLDSDTGGR